LDGFPYPSCKGANQFPFNHQEESIEFVKLYLAMEKGLSRIGNRDEIELDPPEVNGYEGVLRGPHMAAPL